MARRRIPIGERQLGERVTTSGSDSVAFDSSAATGTRIALGLRANWQQFTLLVIVNAFVGAMVGLERSILPVIATDEFHITSTTIVLLFVAMFGLAKAFTNLASGWLADFHARRRVLLLGWFIALPVPLLILYAQSWWWIVAANVLLGVNQGLAWSMTVIMKIDLVGPMRRGLAMGINEFAGYAALAGASVVSGIAGSAYGLRQGAAYPGFVIATGGLLLSLLVRDTSAHVRAESGPRERGVETPRLITILSRSMWTDAGLFSVSQAGLVNNLNDGLAWGVFPLLFLASGLSLREMSLLAAVYPAIWSISQLATGPLSDRWGRKKPIVSGMVAQGAALIIIALSHRVLGWTIGLIALGFGTALVYPALLAAVGDIAQPSWRGKAVGVYRLWRDLGYVAGALLAGVLIDSLGTLTTILTIAVLTAASGLAVAIRLRE